MTTSHGRRRAPISVGALIAAGLLVFASAAWACVIGTAGPRLTGVSPNQATPGSTTTVSGAGWAAGPVALRVAGTSVGTADGPSFSVQVTVPSVAPGFYSVVADQGAVEESMPVRVVQVGGGASTGGSGTPGGSTSISTDGGTGNQVTPPASVPASTGGLASDGIPSRPAQGAPAAAATGAAGGTNAGGVAPGLLGAGPTGGSGRPATASGAPGVGGVGQGSAGAAGAAPATDDGQPGALEAGSSARSASGELWSGFSGGASHRAPGLVDQSGASGPMSQVTVALGLGVVGLGALLGGFAAAELRRRRAGATSPARR